MKYECNKRNAKFGIINDKDDIQYIIDTLKIKIIKLSMSTELYRRHMIDGKKDVMIWIYY